MKTFGSMWKSPPDGQPISIAARPLPSLPPQEKRSLQVIPLPNVNWPEGYPG